MATVDLASGEIVATALELARATAGGAGTYAEHVGDAFFYSERPGLVAPWDSDLTGAADPAFAAIHAALESAVEREHARTVVEDIARPDLAEFPQAAEFDPREAEPPAPFIDAAPVAPARFRPYHYQKTSWRRFFRAVWEGKDKLGIVLPTGTGKTTTFGLIARRIIRKGLVRRGGKPGRVLILAHRGELLKQAAAELESLGVATVLEKAEARAFGADLFDVRTVVGSVQTLQGRRLEQWPRDYFDAIVIDEGHHAAAETYQRIIRHFSTAVVLIVTATPERSDEEKLGVEFVYQYPLTDAIRDGYLCPVSVKRCDVRVDLSEIKTTGGDFNLGELEDRISESLPPIVRGAIASIGERRTVMFTPDVGSARAAAKMFNDLGVSARAVWGASPKQGVCTDRDEILASYQRGEFQVLINCNLLTEGWNCKPVGAIVLARPTQNRSLLMQMIGRGTRLSPATGKTDCMVLDFGWVIGKKGALESPVDLFCEPGHDEEIRAEAKALVESGEIADPMRALAEAKRRKLEREEAERRRDEARRLAKEERDRKAAERAEARRLAKERKAAKEEDEKPALRVSAGRNNRAFKFSRPAFDPVGVASRGLLAPVSAGEGSHGPTKDQIAALERLGITAHPATSGAAADAIAYWGERRDAGLASAKQVAFSVKQGYTSDEALGMTIREAQRVYIAATTRHKVTA